MQEKRDEELEELLSGAMGVVGSEGFRAEVAQRHEERVSQIESRLVNLLFDSAAKPPVFERRNFLVGRKFSVGVGYFCD